MNEGSHRYLGLSLLATTALGMMAGCGVAYQPRPSPRVQVVSDGLGMALVRDNRKYRLGIFGSGVVEAVEGNPRAEEEARAFRNANITGFVLTLVGGVGALAGTFVVVGSAVNQSGSGTLPAAGLGISIGGLACMLVGAVVAASGAPRIWDAINIYNDSLPAYGLPPPPGVFYPPYPPGPPAAATALPPPPAPPPPAPPP